MKTFYTLAYVGAVASIASFNTLSAESQRFDFADPKGVNNVQFKLDAPLESITGTANGISGFVLYDPAAPEKVVGSITLNSASLTVGNPLMKEHLHGSEWLDVKLYESITFAATGVQKVNENGKEVIADLIGDLTIKGITRELVVPVRFTYLPDKLGARMGDPSLKGDLLVIRAAFSINRSDFGIQPGKLTDKVAEEIQLTLSIAGAASRS